MRVLILIDDSDNPTAKETVCRRWSALVPLLAARCDQIILATLREPGPLHEVLQQHGYRTVALRCGSRWKIPMASVRLARFLRDHPVDVIHADETVPALIGGTAAMLSRTASARIYFRSHTEGSTVHNLVSRLATAATTTTMGASQAVARFAIDVDKAADGRIEVVPNGVEATRLPDVGEITDLRNRLGISTEDFVVVSVARLRAEKGLDVLIDAMTSLGSPAGRAPHLVIVGTGPEEDRLRRSASLHDSFVSHFVGHQSELSPWYGIADVVCVPSRREAFGLVVVESMASSRPVIASRVGGLSEVVREGVTGLLVEADDPTALSAALRRLRDDPAERHRLGVQGRRCFRSTFTLELMADGWFASYRRAIESGLVRDPG